MGDWECGHDDDLQLVTTVFAHSTQHFPAGVVGKVDVEEENVRPILCHIGDGFFCRFSRYNGVTANRQIALDNVAQRGFVFDEQDLHRASPELATSSPSSWERVARRRWLI